MRASVAPAGIARGIPVADPRIPSGPDREPFAPQSCPGIQGPPRDRFPIYEHRQIDPENLQLLRRLLVARCWSDALLVYFGPGYDPAFADWVVYIDSAGSVHQGLTQDGRERREFRGEQYIWVIVFSDRLPQSEADAPPAAAAAGTGAGSGEIVISRRSVNHQREPLLSSLLRAFTGRFFAEVESSQATLLDDSTRVETFEQLSSDTTQDSMFVAQLRYGVAERSEVVLSVRPADGYAFPGQLRSIYANLGNASPARWEVGLTGGVSFGAREPVITDDTVVVGTRSGVQPNLYLTGYFNLHPPMLPWRARSIGPVVGLNLARGDLFSEVIAGVAAGRLFDELGLIVGVRARSVADVVRRPDGGVPGLLQRRETWKHSLFMGVDIRF